MAAPYLPDVLVLGAGGTLGIAWSQGLLAGIEQATGVDFRDTEALVGTSAGSFVAASLTAGRRPTRPPHASDARPLAVRPASRGARLLAPPARYAGALASPWATPALGFARPPGRLLRAAALRAIGSRGTSHDDLAALIARRGARWDGRLRVCAVDRGSGRRVVFGSPGAPKATVAQAVAASCSVPTLHRPVRIGDRAYVDGAVWSPTNLDVAPVGEGTRVLCLNPTAGLQPGRTSPLHLLRAAAATITTLEVMTLRARGARVRTVGPAPEIARLMSGDIMDERHRTAVLAGGFAQGLAFALE